MSGQICVRDLKLQGQQKDPACPWGSERELFCGGQHYPFCMEGSTLVKASGCSRRGPCSALSCTRIVCLKAGGAEAGLSALGA